MDDKNLPQLSEKPTDKDSKGHFVKGNKLGVRFGHGQKNSNVQGRPPNKKYISDILRELLVTVPVGSLVPAGVDSGQRTDRLVALALIKKALEGDTKAIDMIFDRTEGKVAERIEGGLSVTIINNPVPGRDDK